MLGNIGALITSALLLLGSKRIEDDRDPAVAPGELCRAEVNRYKIYTCWCPV